MHSLSYLTDVLILLAVSIANVVLSRRLKLSPVLGYLCMGAAIGDYGLGLIKEPEHAHTLSEFGVVFLLFVIGLELTFERLIQMRLFVFGFGGLQLVLTSFSLGFFILYALKLTPAISFFIGSALALSSTAIVLQVLDESKRHSSQVGRLSLSVLLMQDLAVVPLLALLPILATAQNNEEILSTMGFAGLKALIAIILITIFGRVFLRPFFSVIGSAKSDEVYVATTLLIVLGAALLTAELGLSTAMGAFIAGILIAETEYRNRVENSIIPFKSLLLGLFFLSVGMSIDVKIIFDNLDDVFIGATVLLLVKGLIIYLLSRAFKLQNGASIHSALLLCQGSEFAFILFSIAAKQKIFTEELSQLLLVIVSVSMAVTPMFAILGAYIEDKVDSGEQLDKNQEFSGVSDLNSHIVISGFGRVGRVIAQMLYEENYNFIAVDSDLTLVKKARAKGFPVYHGDLGDEDVLKAVGAARAKALILTMNDKISLRKALKNIHMHYPNLEVIVRAEDFKHGRNLRKLGASATVPATIEVGLQMGGALLKNLGISDHEIMDIKERFRRNDYSFTEEVELFSGMTPSTKTDSH